MMSKHDVNHRNQSVVVSVDDLVPKDHLVRKLDAAIDFSFIYSLVEGLYSPIGRPSVDPVVLIKMTLIQYVFGIRSMRQTIHEIETNAAYRWFKKSSLMLENRWLLPQMPPIRTPLLPDSCLPMRSYPFFLIHALELKKAT